MLFFLQVNERLVQPKKPTKDQTRTTIKSIDYDLDNIQIIHKPEIKMKKNKEDNQILNQKTQLLKVKNSSSSTCVLGFNWLIVSILLLNCL